MKDIKWKRCSACKKYHCPSCHNQMDDDLICPMCGAEWKGDEEFHPIDISELFE